MGSQPQQVIESQSISHDCCNPPILMPARQFREIAARFGLAQHLRPFSRSLECNWPLRGIAKAAVFDRLPSAVRAGQEQFTTCDRCHRIYWQGTHWQHMQTLLAGALGVNR